MLPREVFLLEFVDGRFLDPDSHVGVVDVVSDPPVKDFHDVNVFIL